MKRTLRLSLDVAKTNGKIDLPRYSLGQGGFSSSPMIDDHLLQLKNLKPRIIRFFVQEYFDLYPAKGKFNWATLDQTFEAILATGAKPLPAICFKPKRLFPVLNEDIVHPNSYPEWEKLIYALVKHCQSKHYGIEYWEIGNEPNAGDAAGAPYRFTPESYVVYYKHTVRAILKADPQAKVGGPALARWFSPIGEALIKFCGETRFPLHFFSWHLYNDDAEIFREGIRKYKGLLGQYPALKHTETMITEWNQSLCNFNHDPYFQPAHILEVTKIFDEEGLSQSAFYHIRDYFADIDGELSAFIGKKWIIPTCEQLFNFHSHLGIFDNQGRVQPSYYVFKCLSLLTGDRLAVEGLNADIKALAARHGDWVEAIFWSYPSKKGDTTYDCSLDLQAVKGEGWRLKLMRITCEAPAYMEEICMADVKGLKNGCLKFKLARFESVFLQLFKLPEEIGAGVGNTTLRITKRAVAKRA